MSRSTVLLVDDNRAFLDNFDEILSGEGYAVQTATSCAEARAIAASTGFHVALVDLRLPDGDGVELGGELKRLQPEGEVILLTGFASLESAQAAVRTGAWAYLTKPCSTPQLLMAVAQASRHIDERQVLRRRAHAAERFATVGQLTAGLSHEIRNPLNAASLQLTLLERRVGKLDAGLQPPLLEPLRLVKEEIHRLATLLDDFLQYARPWETRSDPVDPRVLAQRVADLLRLQADQAHVRLETRLSGDRKLHGDEHRLQQALLNLVLNALQATPARGWVRIEVSERGGRIEIVVEDSGPGIPEERRDRIFEPFFTTKAGGSGLGLPLAQAIALQHGGDLRIVTGEAGGARFELHVPAS